ncbi:MULTISPECIES: inositol monophosphatase family protein [unclassified Pseudonocardia]|nr:MULTISPECIES: inositol monophosphatase family protein [unclassified Pseudonocardia]
MQGTDVELAIDAVRAGMDVIRRTPGGQLRRIQKSAVDFATAADLDAERAIRSILRACRPGDAFTGEELGESGGARSRMWLVDPLCGTRNFASGAGDYGLNVALCIDGTPTEVFSVAGWQVVATRRGW